MDPFLNDVPFPDVYDWISRLPPPSLWPIPSLHLLLCRFPRQKTSVLLIAKRTENGCISFFIFKESVSERNIFWKRDIQWSNEEDSNDNNMQVITSPLLSLAIASIFHAIHHLIMTYGRFPTEITEDSFNDHSSITQSSNYPLLFNSAFASLCILIFPPLILDRSVRKFISPEILHPELDIQEPLTKYLGELFTNVARLPSGSKWEPLSWSYAGNTRDSCEVKLYCPLLSMNTTHNHALELPNTSSTSLQEELIYQQVECIIQLRYDFTFEGNFLHFRMAIDNVRCDVFPYGDRPNDVIGDLTSTERYFPSKISITAAPRHPPNIVKKISVSHSSANPSYQIAAGTGCEVSYQAPKNVGVKVSGTATSTTNINQWKFEQSAHGMNGTFKWILYDTNDFNGKEVISSKPSKSMWYDSKSAWYKDRYRKACSPFTEQGGVVFASDNYGKSFTWTLNRSMHGQSFKVKIEGTIWLTYWPNLYKTSFYESRYREFSKEIELPLINLQL